MNTKDIQHDARTELLKIIATIFASSNRPIAERVDTCENVIVALKDYIRGEEENGMSNDGTARYLRDRLRKHFDALDKIPAHAKDAPETLTIYRFVIAFAKMYLEGQVS